MSKKEGVSRRDFLKWLVVGVAAAAIAGGAGAAVLRRTSGAAPAISPTPSPKPSPSPTPRPQAGAKVLRISHQWSVNDIRHVWAQKFAQMVEEKTGGQLKFEIYPSQQLFKAAEQWDALVTGNLDITILPLEYASGKAPEVSITLMPCTITSVDHGLKWKEAEIGKRFSQILESYGAKILSWGWFTGGIGSKVRFVKVPEDVKGLKLRAAGRYFEYMMQQAGATVVSMPSSEIYNALQTGVLDTCLTAVESFASYRLYEQIKYYTSHRQGYMIWFMFEPMLISMKTWNSLTPDQQAAMLEAGSALEPWLAEQLKKSDNDNVAMFEKAGVQVYDMTKSDWEAWRDFAAQTAWKKFAQDVPRGQELLDLALQVKP